MNDPAMAYWDLLVFGVLGLLAVGEAVWEWLKSAHSR